MFQVSDIYDDARLVTGFCDEAKIFRWITDAIQLVANKADFEGWVAYIDLCVSDRCVTLPREVETVLGVNIGGKPTLGRNQLFNYHLNGPGDCQEAVAYSYQDRGFYPTYRDIVTPAQLVAFVEKEEDEGSSLRVYGYDAANLPIRQNVNGQWQDGWLIPTIFGYSVPDTDMPQFARVTRIRKEDTAGSIRLSTVDAGSGGTGALLGVYESDEREPWYRRITLGKDAEWIRLAYRRSSPTIRSQNDRIPLRSRMALVLALKALKFYREDDLSAAHAFEVDAVRLEKEASDIAESPTMNPLQVVDLNQLQDKFDVEIV